ncbi:MAG: DUF1998 domain-containing protein, partial [Rhodothermaceae bacterium]|nr:DUF1998 domain-containing protein [Rhodothermaceae bacterium]
MDYVEARNRLVAWLREQMIGPATEDAVVNENPLKLYPVGVLSPTESTSNPRIDDLKAIHPDGPSNAENDIDEALSYRRYYTAPSSVGFTFFVSRDAQLSITVSASRYKSRGERDESGRFVKQSYNRIELQPFEITIDKPSGTIKQAIWENRASIVLEPRLQTNGILCTLALSNLKRGPESLRHSDKAELYLFEVHLCCIVESGDLLELPRLAPSMMSEEELELELQYKERKIFGVGHGAAVDWNVSPRCITKIWSEFMPVVETPALSTNPQGDHDALDLKRLCDEDITTLLTTLRDFLDGYEKWIVKQRKIISGFADELERETGERMVKRMEVALKRMHQGVDLLEDDEYVAEAFRLANQTMLNQMQQADRIEGRDPSTNNYRWRSFQLAFLLTVLESAVQEKSSFRETMDLIWFPTGGGKTEAYLGLIAILIIWRRLNYGTMGGGTVAIMRYTLRLLTRQQFERAARMICALELIRQKDNRLEEEPFSVGFWAGTAVSPNTYDQAKKKVKAIADGSNSERFNFILTSCPWCGEELTKYGYVYTPDSFRFYCTNESNCDFGRRRDSKPQLPLPCQVVDHALYDAPPSLLISTIDKFARLPWIEGPYAFFGRNTRRSPELIIQDELHLVTGPLGSIAGVYEAGIETVIRELGVSPKYIASTATISEARKQVQSLYGRDIEVFPPPGLSCDDMYFATTDHSRPGRKYLGYLAPNLSRQESISPIMAALMAAPSVLFGENQNFADLAEAWWTMIVFNRSLRDVRTYHNEAFRGVRKAGMKFANKNHSQSENHETLDSIRERFQKPRISELTSLRSAEDCAITFKELEHPRNHAKCLDVVFATNMISVGLDVSRLALMVVNGQPQSAGEYIQVTGRIGRAEVPGLVIVNYYRTQARSLAHYENFRPFHESFHRFVETSSITPFTYQARKRALHAALVTTLRYLCNHLIGNAGALKIGEQEEEERQILTQLSNRFTNACLDPVTQTQVDEHLKRLYQTWCDKAEECKKRRRELCYYVRDDRNDADRLLKSAELSVKGVWDTLNSMRNVEESAKLNYGPHTVDVRFSNLLGSSGVGSIVPMGENTESFNSVVKDITLWPQDLLPDQELKYVTQISKHPNISNRRLIRPPVPIKRDDKFTNCIPAEKFPRWSYCIKCGLLSYYSLTVANKCPDESCDGITRQVHWVLVHRQGFLADVDWHYMAHGKKSKDCPRTNDRAYLKLIQEPKYLVQCTKCNRTGWQDIAQFGRKTWQQPWVREPAEEFIADSMAEVMYIGDSRMYQEEKHRSLVIPPESRIRRGSIVDLLYRNSDDQRKINQDQTDFQRKSVIKRIATKYGCGPKEIRDALAEIERGYPLYDEQVGADHLMQLEYDALSNPIPDQREDEDLVTTHHTLEWKERSGDHLPPEIVSLVNSLAAVERLRMVSVFLGFRRDAFRDQSRGSNMKGRPSLVPPDVFGTSDWLPADELYGEGIFFTLSEPLLQVWEEKVRIARQTDRELNKLLGRIDSSMKENDEVSKTPRFVLCHSLSHLLIRQLERNCGYPSASLKERIYVKDGERPMAGILIFVAVSDKHGSLGGLTEWAQPQKFYRLISRAFDASQWCSFDPVCCNPEDSKLEQLNGAACHACLMIPESSCCCNNKYLDRILINGN